MAAINFSTKSEFTPYVIDNQATGINSDDEKAWIYKAEEFPAHRKSRPPKVILKIIGLIKDFLFTIGTYFSRISHRANYKTNIEDQGGNSEALCVFLHGLKGHPSIMDGHRDNFRKHLNRKLALFQPFIPKGGNCSTAEATKGIYQRILGWSQNNPNKPIIFCGVSNGARLSGHIVSMLRVSDQVANPIKINCLAGPFFGTKMLNQPDWSDKGQKIWGKLIRTRIGGNKSSEIITDLSYGSEKSKQLIRRIREAAKSPNTSFDFYGTRGDLLVTPFTSSLPKGVDNANYFVLKHEGHSSIVKASKAQTLKETKKFLESIKTK